MPPTSRLLLLIVLAIFSSSSWSYVPVSGKRVDIAVGSLNNSTLRASSVGLDASNTSNSRSKTLATLGSGSIEVANLDDNNIRNLNRDLNNTEIDIYDVQSSQTLQGTVDVRVLSEGGRAEIRQEVREFGKNMQTVANGVPRSQGGNVIENAIGKILDVLSKYTMGMVPSELANGGILAANNSAQRAIFSDIRNNCSLNRIFLSLT